MVLPHPDATRDAAGSLSVGVEPTRPGVRTLPGRARTAWLAAVVAASTPASALAPDRLEGQVVAGLVAEQVSLSPARGALVSLLRLAGPEEGALETVAVTTADGEGAFVLEAPGPGAYRVQADADGLVSPLSAVLELGPGDAIADLALLVPSRLLLMAYACAAEAPEGSAVVVGVVHDPASGLVLPAAKVTATWRDGSTILWGEAVTDAGGRYRICGMRPSSGVVRIRGEILGRQGPWTELRVDGPAVVFHDVDVEIPTRGSVEGDDVVHQRILLEAAARTLGDLRGRLLDQMSGTALPWAVVRLEGTPHQALSDEDGRFLFEGLRPGDYTLQIRHLGYAVRSRPLSVPEGQDVFVELKVAPQVVELEGFEVTTRGAVEQVRRLTPFRRDIVYGEAMLEEEIRGARAFETLRHSVPGLRVREIYREGHPAQVCIETNRRVQSISEDNICHQVQVVVDGVRIPDAGLHLRNLATSEIESMEFLPPMQAQTRYGLGGDTANGVVVIWTRGKGPYTSPLRNRR